MNYKDLKEEYETLLRREYKTLIVGITDYGQRIQQSHRQYFLPHVPGVYLKGYTFPKWPYCKNYYYKNDKGNWLPMVPYSKEKNNKEYFRYFRNIIINHDLKIVDDVNTLLCKYKVDKLDDAVEFLPLYSKKVKLDFMSVGSLIDHTEIDCTYESVYVYISAYIGRYYYSIQKLSRNSNLCINTDEWMSELYHTQNPEDKITIDLELEEILINLNDSLFSIYDDPLIHGSISYRRVNLEAIGKTTFLITLGEDDRVLQWYEDQIQKHEPDYDGYDSFGNRSSKTG